MSLVKRTWLLALLFCVLLLLTPQLSRAQEESGEGEGDEDSAAVEDESTGEETGEETGEGSSEGSAPAAVGAALESSEESSTSAATDEETGEESVNQVPTVNGAKVTLVSNVNTLTHVASAPKVFNHYAAEEQDEKAKEESKSKKALEEGAKKKLEEGEKAIERKKLADKLAYEKKVQEMDEKKKAAKLKEIQAKAAIELAKQKAAAAAKLKAAQESGNKKKSEAQQKHKNSQESAAKKKRNSWGAHWWRRPGWWGGFHHSWRQKIQHVHSRPYHHSYETPHFFRWNNHCTGAGLMSVHGNYLGRSPGHCRPHNGRLIFAQHAGRESRVDILPDGRIYHITGRSAGWLSLDGMSFSVNRPHGVSLGWGWRYYGSGYRAGTQSNTANLCTISGIMRGSHWSYIGRVMGSCYPNGGRLIFSGNNHHYITRLDILTNGYIVRSGGYTSHGWVSFDGMVYPRYQGNGVSFFGGWTHYHSGYRYGNYRRIGPICVLSGLIRTWTRSSQILRLPSGCRPRARLLFGANTHNHDARVDILPDGRVLNVARLSGHNWVSLSGISFIAYR